jgi:hypothetical protein
MAAVIRCNGQLAEDMKYGAMRKSPTISMLEVLNEAEKFRSKAASVCNRL